MKKLRFNSSLPGQTQSKALEQQVVFEEQIINGDQSVAASQQWQEYFYWLDKFIQLCRKESQTCVVLLAPVTVQLEIPYSQAYPQQKIHDFLKKYNVEVIDLLPPLQMQIKEEIFSESDTYCGLPTSQFINQNFDAIQVKKAKYFLDWGHFSQEGHNFVTQ